MASQNHNQPQHHQAVQISAWSSPASPTPNSPPPINRVLPLSTRIARLLSRPGVNEVFAAAMPIYQPAPPANHHYQDRPLTQPLPQLPAPAPAARPRTDSFSSLLEMDPRPENTRGGMGIETQPLTDGCGVARVSNESKECAFPTSEIIVFKGARKSLPTGKGENDDESEDAEEGGVRL